MHLLSWMILEREINDILTYMYDKKGAREPFLTREAMLSAVYAVVMCLSVTLRYCIKT